MSEYVIVRHKGLYKIYKLVMNHDDLYQYAGASFSMLSDAQDFVDMRKASSDAA